MEFRDIVINAFSERARHDAAQPRSAPSPSRARALRRNLAGVVAVAKRNALPKADSDR
jgi:hypothetical protein